jgi:hypothetical protein
MRLYELGSVLVARKLKNWVRERPCDLRSFLDAAATYERSADFKGKLLARNINAVNRSAAFIIERADRMMGNSRTHGLWELTVRRMTGEIHDQWTLGLYAPMKSISFDALPIQHQRLHGSGRIIATGLSNKGGFVRETGSHVRVLRNSP